MDLQQCLCVSKQKLMPILNYVNLNQELTIPVFKRGLGVPSSMGP